jgi:hypothetical protein
MMKQSMTEQFCISLNLLERNFLSDRGKTVKTGENDQKRPFFDRSFQSRDF